jgi:hypothetical protein
MKRCQPGHAAKRLHSRAEYPRQMRIVERGFDKEQLLGGPSLCDRRHCTQRKSQPVASCASTEPEAVSPTLQQSTEADALDAGPERWSSANFNHRIQSGTSTATAEFDDRAWVITGCSIRTLLQTLHGAGTGIGSSHDHLLRRNRIPSDGPFFGPHASRLRSARRTLDQSIGSAFSSANAACLVDHLH